MGRANDCDMALGFGKMIERGSGVGDEDAVSNREVGRSAWTKSGVAGKPAAVSPGILVKSELERLQSGDTQPGTGATSDRQTG